VGVAYTKQVLFSTSSYAGVYTVRVFLTPVYIFENTLSDAPLYAQIAHWRWGTKYHHTSDVMSLNYAVGLDVARATSRPKQHPGGLFRAQGGRQSKNFRVYSNKKTNKQKKAAAQ